MKISEISDILIKSGLDQDRIFNGDYDSTEIHDLIGKIKVVHSEGGSEGDGEYVELVIHLSELDFYLKSTATYMSYSGTDYWTNWSLVKPIQKMVTFYE